jgi:predicted Rossmann fold nucleotide-binding protein DprA/Smf involved in DNA uptake
VDEQRGDQHGRAGGSGNGEGDGGDQRAGNHGRIAGFGSLSVATSTKRTTDRGRDTLLDAIDYIPTSVDQIIVRSGLTAAKVCSMLIGMEIAGKIRNCDGRYLRNLGS